MSARRETHQIADNGLTKCWRKVEDCASVSVDPRAVTCRFCLGIRRPYKDQVIGSGRGRLRCQVCGRRLSEHRLTDNCADEKAARV